MAAMCGIIPWAYPPALTWMHPNPEYRMDSPLQRVLDGSFEYFKPEATGYPRFPNAQVPGTSG